MELTTTTIRVATVDMKALQENVEQLLKGEGIRPAYLYGRRCDCRTGRPQTGD